MRWIVALSSIFLSTIAISQTPVANYQFSQHGWMTVLECLPQGVARPNRMAFALGDMAGQGDIRSLHPDGSMNCVDVTVLVPEEYTQVQMVTLTVMDIPEEKSTKLWARGKSQLEFSWVLWIPNYRVVVQPGSSSVLGIGGFSAEDPFGTDAADCPFKGPFRIDCPIGSDLFMVEGMGPLADYRLNTMLSIYGGIDNEVTMQINYCPVSSLPSPYGVSVHREELIPGETPEEDQWVWQQIYGQPSVQAVCPNSHTMKFTSPDFQRAQWTRLNQQDVAPLSAKLQLGTPGEKE